MQGILTNRYQIQNGYQNIFYFSCQTTQLLTTAIIHILPNYLATYLPMLTVMIANPLLYGSSMKGMEREVTSSYGQLTRRERDVMDAFRIKFAVINIVFYICWLPNLINAVLLWCLWFHLPVRVIITIWYIMVNLPTYNILLS